MNVPKFDFDPIEDRLHDDNLAQGARKLKNFGAKQQAQSQEQVQEREGARSPKIALEQKRLGWQYNSVSHRIL
jgi:hypothetical protein